MSTEQGKCPICGAESGPREGSQKVRWECGSNIELSEFGDSCHFANEEFKQSDLCKLRQRDQLIAECLAFIDNYATHYDGCPNNRSSSCTCELDDKLAALQSRAKGLCK